MNMNMNVKTNMNTNMNVKTNTHVSANTSVVSRRSSVDKLQERFPNARIVDVTSKGREPWVRFSPFYPHGNIPVPLSPGLVSMSVEGIWQALKVFETCDVDKGKLSVSTMKGIKRTVRSLGKVLGHRAGACGERLLSYGDARREIYLPAYLWVLDNCLTEQVDLLREIVARQQLILLDYETNCDINDLSSPLSHAGLIKCHLEGNWPC